MLKTQSKWVCCRISGGVDSAVTSTYALKQEKVLCVEMPIHQHESHVSRGREHIKQLRNRYPNVSETSADLTSVLKALKTWFPLTLKNTN
jgi:NAD+ synthase